MNKTPTRDEKNLLFFHALQGLKWNYIGTAGRIASQLIAQITLARILGPNINGQFSAVALLLLLGAIWAEMGMSAAMVQSNSVNDTNDHSRACTRMMFSSLTLTFLVFIFSEYIALHWISSPESINVLKAMAFTMPLNTLSIPPTVKLRRQLDFKSIQIIQLTSYVIGYLVIGVPMAWLGYGIWSLVTAWISQLVILNLLSWRKAPAPFHFSNPASTCHWTQFGLTIVSTNTINWATENIIPMCVNFIFGSHAMGIFNTTNNLARTPANHLVISLQNVLFPFSSKLQQDHTSLRQIFLTSSASLLLVSMPFFMTVVMLSDQIVRFILGEKWLEAIVVLQPLAFSMIPHTLMAIAGPILNAAGQPLQELKVQASSMVILILAIFASQNHSIEFLCWVMALIFFIRALWIIHAVRTLLDIKIQSFYRLFRGPVILGFLVIFVTLAAKPFIESIGVGYQLAINLGCISIVCIVGLYFQPRFFLAEEIISVLLKLKNCNARNYNFIFSTWLLKIQALPTKITG